MFTLEAILRRRSVRSFTSEPISIATTEQLLLAGMNAPSAVNEQPWHFMVINERTMLDKIPSVHPHAAMCHQAAIAIIPCVDMGQEKYRDFWVQDMAAATQNILILARDLGLGAVWVGVYPDEKRIQDLKKLLNLPEKVIPFAIIPVGCTKVKQDEIPERFKPERIHYNKW